MCYRANTKFRDMFRFFICGGDFDTTKAKKKFPEKIVVLTEALQLIL